jgi:putative ABC transport system permease protein
VEYFFLGLISAGAAVVLATASTWALARFLFEAPYHFALLPSVIAIVSVCAITMGMGWIGTRGLISRPPLEVLRQET